MEDDALFPSGPWTGFYNYTGPEDRHRMDLHLTFARGGIAGEGSDDIGPFLIRGRYDTPARECHWTKTYIGGHDVFYRGFRDTHGIWGTWEIGTWNKGGFHIWPRSQSEGNAPAKKAQADPPAEAIGTEVPAAPERDLEHAPRSHAAAPPGNTNWIPEVECGILPSHVAPARPHRLRQREPKFRHGRSASSHRPQA